METFLREQLERFLQAVDAALVAPVEVVVIGGTAAALHYGVRRLRTISIPGGPVGLIRRRGGEGSCQIGPTCPS